jgi:hypothetical protein
VSDLIVQSILQPKHKERRSIFALVASLGETFRKDVSEDIAAAERKFAFLARHLFGRWPVLCLCEGLRGLFAENSAPCELGGFER